MDLIADVSRRSVLFYCLLRWGRQDRIHPSSELMFIVGFVYLLSKKVNLKKTDVVPYSVKMERKRAKLLQQMQEAPDEGEGKEATPPGNQEKSES